MPSDLPAYRNDYVEIRINRRLFIAMLASLLVHAMLLIFMRPHVPINIRPVSARDTVLNVRLAPLAPAPMPFKQPSYQRPHAQTPLHRTPPPAIPGKRITPPKQTVLATPNEPAPPAPVTPADAVPTDMTSYINAVRARRQMLEREDGTDREPSEDAIRNANIRRNLQPQGAGGIFQIMWISTRTAEFSFRGWGNTYNNGRRQEIEVEADAGTDIEHAIIRKMISIIRKRHNGDFSWESQRLNRVVTLSARLEDNAGLEDFLMREFFKAGLRPAEQ